MIIDSLVQADTRSVDAVSLYQPDAIYWVFVDDKSVIHNMFSFDLDCDIEESQMGSPVRLGSITENAFTIIKKSLLGVGVVCLLDAAKEEIVYYRLMSNVNKIDDDRIQVQISLADEYNVNQLLDSCTLKSAKLPSKDNKKLQCTIKDVDVNMFDVKFHDPGNYNLKVVTSFKDIRVKCYIPWSI